MMKVSNGIKIAAVLGLFVLFMGTSLQAATVAPAYPAGFLWGAAISAHQTEGLMGGGENGDWYSFEHSLLNGKSPIAQGDTADVAVDFWNRYPEDLRIARSLAITSLRISLAWEKIEPQEGVFNADVIAHYREILVKMKELGIRPMVALQHFTHPLWFQAQGSWLSDRSPELFADYADYVVGQLGDVCDLWITFNEPMVIVNEGFIKGIIPPQIHSIHKALDAAFNLARAHRLATARIHLRQPPLPRSVPGLHGVGLVNSLPLYSANNPDNPIELLVAGAVDEFANWAFLKAAVNGEFAFKTFDLQGEQLDVSRAIPAVASTGSPRVDWLGVNYYTQYVVSVDWKLAVHIVSKSATGVVGDNGWAVYPQGLEAVLRKAVSRFSDVPWIVSENGVSDATDQIRPKMIQASLQSLDHVMTGAHPLDIRGYYHWSLMDNFEWLLGYTQKFGLVAIDFQNGLTRTPRPSAWIYRDEIDARSGQDEQ
jgi:beta-glucosidase